MKPLFILGIIENRLGTKIFMLGSFGITKKLKITKPHKGF